MKYGLIGEKLGHSYSKLIHEKLADYTYDLIELSKEEFQEFMQKKSFTAINVTIPYKCDVIPFLDVIDENAKKIGAVNTIVNHNQQLYGYNTDFLGFLYTLQYNEVQIENQKVILLGNGGAAKAIIAVLEYLGAGEIIRVNRTLCKGVISYEECIQLHTDATVMINTTPVGMYPNTDFSPIELTNFTNLSSVIDIIYNPSQTKLLKEASESKIKAINGLSMLIAQAKYAVEFFLDTKIPDSVIPDIQLEIEQTLLKKL